MRKCISIFLALYLPVLLISQNEPAFTSMDVFELEWVTSPQISPDGNKIVYERRGMDLMKDSRTSSLWIINADGTEHYKLTEQNVRESSPSWSPDGQRIAFTSSTDEGSELFIYWVKTGKIARISQLPNSPRGLSWSADGKWLAFSMFVNGSELSLVKPHKKPKGAKWADAPRVTTRVKHEADGSGYMKPGYSHLFVIPSEGGTYRQISSGNYHHKSQPQWTPDGKMLVFNANRKENWEYDFRNSEIYSLNITNGAIEALTDRDGPDSNPIVSPDGKKIAYIGFKDKREAYQIRHLYTMNIDGTDKTEIKMKLDRSIYNIQWSSDAKGVYFQYDNHGDTKIGYTDLSGKVTEITGSVGGTSIGRPYGGGSYTVSNNEKIAFTLANIHHPAELGVVSKGEKSQKVMSLNDDLLNYRTLGTVEEVWYKSSYDNRDIQGWIVKPPHFEEGKKYPMLVENHGGPILNYGFRFSPEIQLYATAGYVVFYPNPRGSTSYGEEFGNLLYRNYPGQDYDDVMDGVDAVLKLGYTSEDSLFVTGGSAGGIMTAWMIGKNKRFEAAAVIKPVMNWISKTLVADNYYGYANSRYEGQPWENLEHYWKFSPISLVGNIETPTLVMVGMNDLRTPPSEAKQLYHALKLRNIETALVEIPGSYHFIGNRPSQMITKVEHIIAWFERYRK
ncbi:MAG: prolyl oligopeptidase family serine peptidase [Saprospiraceae bacterium]